MSEDLDRTVDVPAPGRAAAPAAPVAPFSVGAIGRYTIVRELARGGMGVVYVAHDTELERDVAIKALLRRDDEGQDEDSERFKLEGKAVARLNHPNIVQVYDVGEHEGNPYLVMDFIDGTSLDQQIRAEGRLSSRDAARITLSIAQGLAYAHSCEVFHRDLKPQNVLLSADGEPKVTDFGIAKFAGRSERRAQAPSTPAPPQAQGGAQLTQVGQVLGTPAYMSPEQAAGDPTLIDGRTDVYGLGATLYEMLTGRPPFHGDSLQRVIESVMGEEPVRPAALQPSVDRRLEAICLRCLEKDRDARYPSAAALAVDLEAWLGEADSGSPRQSRNSVVIGLVGLVGVATAAALPYVFETPPAVVDEGAAGESATPTSAVSASAPAVERAAAEVVRFVRSKGPEAKIDLEAMRKIVLARLLDRTLQSVVIEWGRERLQVRMDYSGQGAIQTLMTVGDPEHALTAVWVCAGGKSWLFFPSGSYEERVPEFSLEKVKGLVLTVR